MKARIPILERFAWQEPVIRFESDPPGSPTKGDRYIIEATASGDWTGEENNVAWWTGTEWQIDTAVQGWSAYNKADDKLYRFDGTAWTVDSVDGKMDTVPAATEDHLASFDGAGQVKDSGVKTPEFDDDLGVIFMEFPE